MTKNKRPKTLIGQYSLSASYFFAGILCIIYGAFYQGELIGTGSTHIGRNGAYVTVAGEDAQTNINCFWGGAIVFITAALIQLIITSRKELKNPLPFDDSHLLMICPKCEKPFSIENSEKEECPDCQVALAKLKGFYD